MKTKLFVGLLGCCIGLAVACGPNWIYPQPDVGDVVVVVNPDVPCDCPDHTPPDAGLPDAGNPSEDGGTTPEKPKCKKGAVLGEDGRCHKVKCKRIDPPDHYRCACSTAGHGNGSGHCKTKHKTHSNGHGNGHCKYDCN